MKILFIQLLHGILLTLAFHPFDIFLVIPISFGGFLYFLEKDLLDNYNNNINLEKLAFKHSFLFFFGHFLSSLYWLAIPIITEIKLYWYLLPLALVLLPGFLASFYGYVGYFITKRLINKYLAAGGPENLKDNIENKSKVAIAFAIGFFLAELARTAVVNFPWNLLGYATNYSLSLMQLASVTSVYGLSLLLFFLGVLAYSRNASLISLVLIVTVLITITGNRRLYYGNLLDNKKKFISLFLLQPNFPYHHFDDKKRLNDYDKTIDLIGNLPLKDQVDKIQNRTKIVFLPEGVMPFAIPKNSITFLEELLEEINNKYLFLIMGIDRFDDQKNYFNSMIALNSFGEIVDDYDKIALVPFGEYLPFVDFFQPIVSDVSSFTPGRSTRNLKLFPKNNSEAITIIPLICFESIFSPILFPRSLDKVDFILNLTNDSWFKNSLGPYQHFAMSRMRAIEYGVPLVRVAKTGISAIVNSYGKIINKIPLGEEGILIADLPEDKVDTHYFSFVKLVRQL
jgi:apolipoprotein N-acyltransferase